MSKIQVRCGECDGECELKFNEHDYVEPDHCPFCGVKLAEWEMDYIDE